MSLESESPPAKRKRNEAPIKRSELWFSDGSVILQAANTQFRVHLGVLARHSVIFRRQGLVQSSDEPTVDGCPIVRLPDDPTDVEYLLKSLYDPTFHSRPRLPLPVVGALLRLGSKYRFKDLLDSTVARLTAEYPTTLVKYDAVRATFETIEWYFGIEIDMVTLLSETRMFSAFPCACIRLLQLFDLDELFDGTDRSDGTCASLSRTDLRICAIARQKLLYKQFEPGYTLGWVREEFDGCRSPLKCSAERKDLLNYYTQNYKIWALLSTGCFGSFHKLCTACNWHATQSIIAGRKKMWQELPELFNLPPWNELTNDL